MKRSPWTPGILASAAVALLAASVMSLVDWRLNPGGLFYGGEGTHWSVVWETWVSWFLPVFLLTGGVVLPLLLWRSRRQ